MIVVFETERYLLKTNGPKLGPSCFICKQGDTCFECVRFLRPINSNIGSFEKFVFPRIAATWPKLEATNMQAQSSYVYLCSDICINMYAMSHML